MRGVVLVILALTSVLAGAAQARPPSSEDLPTVKSLIEQAAQAIEQRRKDEEERRRDPKMDRIQAYRDKATNIFDWKEIAEILKDDKEASKYRIAAAAAFRARFQDLDRSESDIAGLMKRIGSDLLPKLNDKDQNVRTWIYSVLKVFWPGKAQVFKFKPEDGNYRARHKAWKEWRDFLK